MAHSENISGSPDIGGPIDLVAFAKETTRRDLHRVAPGSVKVIAPAKVNLFLGVGASREDGYHDVSNVLHAIMLHDVLYMKSSPVASEDIFGDALIGAPHDARSEQDPQGSSDAQDSQGSGAQGTQAGLRITVQCVGYEGVEVPDIAASDNLAYKAVDALARELGRTENEHMHIRIEKHIPHQAGLGGGSSDAAAALAGAAHLWGVEGHPSVQRVAERLGADVAFFLQGGCALFTERGEAFHHAIEPRKDNIVLIKPEGGLSTADVYREFDFSHVPVADADVRAVLEARNAPDVPLVNNLTEPAERLMPELARVREWASGQPGARSAMLSGSGAASFVLCEDFDAACKLAAAAKLEGWWARTTALCAAKVAVGVS